MLDDASTLLKSARDWASHAITEGWLPQSAMAPFDECENSSPASLFETSLHRPLVAAFFGGTGVGKSTLLNRLACEAVAKTGVERPTSREISLYVHDTVLFRNFPPDFPLEKIHIAYHHNERHRPILWVDMPDIDSVEQRNRALVLAWLPYVDVLIYVVSPERYRDDRGWQLLRAHGEQHAWLFIINQWDRAHPVQYDDFMAILTKGGFENPILFRTDSRLPPSPSQEDDLGKLNTFIHQLVEEHIVEQLEVRAEDIRLHYLENTLLNSIHQMGKSEDYIVLQAAWKSLWNSTQSELLKGVEWIIQYTSQDIVSSETRSVFGLIRLEHTAPPSMIKNGSTLLLWDEWAQSRLQDTLDQLLIEAGYKNLPILPLKKKLTSFSEKVGKMVSHQGQIGLRSALAHPGNRFQRMGLTLFSLLAVVLPIGAVLWSSYYVVKGYYESAIQQGHYLGEDFAIHTGLLIFLAWLMPTAIKKAFTPSLRKAAIKGLRSGVREALEKTYEEGKDHLASVQQDHAKMLEQGHILCDQIRSVLKDTQKEEGLITRLTRSQHS